jgi:hypothetical protein
VVTRLRLRFEASRWRNSAISLTRRRSCEKPRAFDRKEAVARARCGDRSGSTAVYGTFPTYVRSSPE